MRPLARSARGRTITRGTADAENPSATSRSGTAFARGRNVGNFIPADRRRKSITARGSYDLVFGRAGDAGAAARFCTRGGLEQNVRYGSEGLWSKAMAGGARDGEPPSKRCSGAAKSKRYPQHTSMQRLLLCAFLGIDAQEAPARRRRFPCARAGVRRNRAGRMLRRDAERLAELPIVNAGERGPDDGACIALELRAAQRFIGLFCRTTQSGGRQTACRKRNLQDFPEKNSYAIACKAAS